MAGTLTAPATSVHDTPKERHAADATADQIRSTTLVVDGMHCGGCLRKVEGALSSIAGVLQARANLSAKRVHVDYRPGETDVVSLLDAVGRAGFRATELAPTAPPPDTVRDNDYLKRLAVAGFAAANIMLLSVSVWSGASGDMPASLQSMFHWLSALIALPAIAYAGQPFFRSAAQALGARRINMDVPISLGVTLATLMSVYQTVRGSEQVYFDAAITLLFFLLIGRALDARMRVGAASAAANLLALRAHVATIVEPDGTARRAALGSITPGMHVLTAAGEHFAADGRLISGASEVDEGLITGETRPRNVSTGDLVFAGTLNLGQPVTVEVTATSDTALVSEIARLMSAAEQGRASYVRLADRAARIYAPAVHALGLATFVGWMIAGHGWEPALTAAIAVLIITCPCALALAVPAVQIAAIGRLFSKGVIVKVPDALERLAEIDTVVFDKTGTLTLGEPALVADDTRTERILGAAAALAASSRHPYARAIVRAARANGLDVVPSTDVVETSGLGLARTTSQGEERLGSARWCNVPDAIHASLWYTGAKGGEDAAPVPFRLVDDVRPDAADVVATLQSAGFATELLSGDRPEEVERVAAALGLTRHAARLLPAGKLDALSELAARGHKVLMVGDGLNDAPALAAAHASMSPATAADVSQTAADAIFQGSRLGPVLETIAVAREAQRMSLQNFGIALGYNLVFVPLAVAGLVTPLIAAIAMSASSIAVTANAARLRHKALRLGSWRSGV